MRNTSNCTLRITKSTPKKPCCSSEKTDKEAALQTLRQRFPCVRPMPRRGGINARLAYDFFRFLKRPPGESPATRPLKCQRVDLIVGSGDARSSGGRHRRNWRWGPRCIVGCGDGRPWPGRGQPRQKWRCSRKKAASISGGSREGKGSDHRLQCTRSSFTHALSTRPFSRSSSHASPTCSRHFFGRVESEPHISRNVSSLSGYGSLWVAK